MLIQLCAIPPDLAGNRAEVDNIFPARMAAMASLESSTVTTVTVRLACDSMAETPCARIVNGKHGIDLGEAA